jgi:hypothetical protein
VAMTLINATNHKFISVARKIKLGFGMEDIL